MSPSSSPIDLTPGKLLHLKPSELAKAILQLRGKPLDLAEYKPFELVYDVAPLILTAICGRQIGKSVSLASSIISNSIIRKHFYTLFISPLAQQTSRFSGQYLEPFSNSPIVRRHFINSSSKQNVFSRTFSNGSSITLGYAETEQDADRIRGVAADAFYYDEIQDASKEAIPILEETLNASHYKFRRFTGTAKGESNTLTALFKESNQLEWVVKCHACGRHTIPIDYETCLKVLQINPKGPGCAHCGALINMREGKWLAARPDIKNHVGVHIPQICIPDRTTPKQWAELVSKATRYDHIKLCNEVFGIPVGSGGRPLSIQEVMATCNPNKEGFDKGFPRDERNIVVTVLGVDWSCTGSTKSYTVATVLGYDYQGKCYVLYSQKFDGIDVLEQVARVEQLYQQFECSMIGSDRGVGVLQAKLMQQDLGKDKVSIINYVAANFTLRYDPKEDYYSGDRTQMMDTMLIKTKLGRRKIECPKWEVMAPFWQDALHLYEEESQAGRRLFRKDDDGTDDFFHSLTFGNIAYMIVKGEFVYRDHDAVQSDLLDF
jgi:hypothetical protein